MDELTKRNFLALSDGLKEQRSNTSKLTIQVKSLEGQLGALQGQIQEMQSKLMALFAHMQGNGATKR